MRALFVYRCDEEIDPVPAPPLTLMAVHAHPDDEASSTGGLLARCAAEGVRSILVTCTDGALGDDIGGAKPNTEGHDIGRVVEQRKAELARSCSILGVSEHFMLEYADSGMMGWPENDAPGSFWSMDVAEAAKPLVALMEKYRPQVVVTYDENGFYGHPDHIQAHRIAIAAANATGIPAKIYFPTFPRSAMAAFFEALSEAGADIPEPEDAGGEVTPPEEFGTPDDEVSAWIDCSGVVEKKRQALAAHASQTEATFFMKIAPERFVTMFSTEAYVRHFDTTGAPTPETDLFAGLR
jgi:LmbE family N-acetylglucosaminyl deacetylase